MATLRAAWRAWSRYRTFGVTRDAKKEADAEMYKVLYTEVAAELGLSCESLGPILRLSDGTRHFHAIGPITDHERLPLNRICGDKEVTRILLEKAGFSIPAGRGFSLDEERAAWAFASQLDGSSVVKPARSTAGGIAVTVNITTRKAFREAFWKAGLLSKRVLVEQFVSGENYRILVLKGRCLSAVHRILPAVTGDGRSTIDALIDQENARRVRRQAWKPGDPWLMPLPRDRTARALLRRQGWALNSVLPEGMTAVLSEVCNRSYGASHREVFHEIHPEILAVSGRIGELFGLVLTGVDLIAPDLSRPDYWINEVNTTPGPVLSYLLDNPESARNPVHRMVAEYFGRPWPDESGPRSQAEGQR